MISVRDFQQRCRRGVGLAWQILYMSPCGPQRPAGDTVVMAAQQQVNRMLTFRDRRHDHPYHGMGRTAARTILMPGRRVWQQVVLRHAESRRAPVSACIRNSRLHYLSIGVEHRGL
jgi:hypothetical protein